MGKNLEWLKNLIGKNFHNFTDMRNEAEDGDDKMYYAGKVDGLYIALELIDQLDETEKPTISQDWLAHHYFEIENFDGNEFVSDGETAIDGTPQIRVIALQDLKQVVSFTSEPLGNPEELPVVPQFVADFYESYKIDISQGIYELCQKHNKEQFDSRLVDWMRDSESKFVEILISMKNGYEIEKPKHPILQAFDEKAEEFKEYSDSYRRMMEVREAIESVIEEEEE